MITNTKPAKTNTNLISAIATGHPLMVAYSLGLIVLLLVLAMAYGIDKRTILGENIWLKPIKFAIAIPIYLLTLSLFTHFLSPSWRQSKRFNRFVTVVCFTVVLEMAWLIYAAAIGEPSHFNQTHPLLAKVYFLMGLIAIILTSLAAVIGVGLLRSANEQHGNQLNPTLNYSVAFSLIATTILTIVIAGYMASAPGQTHAVSEITVINHQASWPIVGWLKEAGDLRVPHFFATHALHAVPLMALLVVWLTPKRITQSTRYARMIGVSLSGAYSIWVIGLFVQALSGQTFI